MNTTSLPSLRPLRRLALFAAVLGFGLTAAFAGDPTGTWTLKGTGRDGAEHSATLTLQGAPDKLTGTIENRAGKVPIRDVRFANDELSFNVVRKIRRRELTVHYTARLEGDQLKGSLEAKARRGKDITVQWEASRSAAAGTSSTTPPAPGS
ncbi:hypothetical protein [Opitutus sp. ER46]|uniref:hypothetical protein n=1 Tax=Opitutus sp. ER46 TaxID=2161864 RepID=UPI000D30DD35|nr:hypothetical protein [Opitutus sp. ER46]PTX91695.1 hypothetical protein DB354_17675 [Opitutus sp. ER46]